MWPKDQWRARGECSWGRSVLRLKAGHCPRLGSGMIRIPSRGGAPMSGCVSIPAIVRVHGARPADMTSPAHPAPKMPSFMSVIYTREETGDDRSSGDEVPPKNPVDRLEKMP